VTPVENMTNRLNRDKAIWREKGKKARKQCCYRARLAEQSQRFEDMISLVNNIIEISSNTEPNDEGAELSVEERNLFSVAYKNVVGKKRTSWRAIKTIQSKYEKYEKDDAHAKLVLKYTEKIEEEIVTLCSKVGDLIDNVLLSRAKSHHGKVFFRKMAADYQRYLCEVFEEELLKNAAEKSLMYYKLAAEYSDKNLHPTDPIRLGVALNFSVFYYETMRASDRACHLARSAFDDALAELDQLPEEHYTDSTILLQLIRDNLQKWSKGNDYGPIVRNTL
jgi:14-3-3 protein epsilon